jgi:hypothetical protein
MIVEVITFSVILCNSELVTIYRKYDEIVHSHDGIVEGPSRLRCDDVSSSNAFPRK